VITGDVVEDEILTIRDIAGLYKVSEGSVRTALWRYRKYGSDPGVPEPIMIRGRYRWLKSAVQDHLRCLTSKAGIASRQQSQSASILRNPN